MDNKKSYFTFLMFILTIVVFDVIAMQCIRYHNKNDDVTYFIIACIIYGFIISTLIFKSLNFGSIPLINFSWFCTSALINILIGYYIFNEDINNTKLLGIIVAFIGVIIMFFSE